MYREERNALRSIRYVFEVCTNKDKYRQELATVDTKYDTVNDAPFATAGSPTARLGRPKIV